MNRKQLVSLINSIGTEEDEVFMRGDNSFIIPITNIIAMNSGEICLINGCAEISVKKALDDLKNIQKNCNF